MGFATFAYFITASLNINGGFRGFAGLCGIAYYLPATTGALRILMMTAVRSCIAPAGDTLCSVVMSTRT